MVHIDFCIIGRHLIESELHINFVQINYLLIIHDSLVNKGRFEEKVRESGQNCFGNKSTYRWNLDVNQNLKYGFRDYKYNYGAFR